MLASELVRELTDMIDTHGDHDVRNHMGASLSGLDYGEVEMAYEGHAGADIVPVIFAEFTE